MPRITFCRVCKVWGCSFSFVSINSYADILLQESTYGTHIHEKREERESRFTALVQDIVNRGGRCLIPVFALGRAQELLLILGKYGLWRQQAPRKF
jgi:Cft2 family RNA processing exonuclease